MTFKDLQKLIKLQSDSEQNKLVGIAHNKPFWIWDIQEHKLEDIRTK